MQPLPDTMQTRDNTIQTRKFVQAAHCVNSLNCSGRILRNIAERIDSYDTNPLGSTEQLPTRSTHHESALCQGDANCTTASAVPRLGDRPRAVLRHGDRSQRKAVPRLGDRPPAVLRLGDRLLIPRFSDMEHSPWEELPPGAKVATHGKPTQPNRPEHETVLYASGQASPGNFQ